MAKDFKELGDMLCSLRDFLNTYKEMKEGSRYSSPVIIKNVQDSIKELCTLIVKETTD